LPDGDVLGAAVVGVWAYANTGAQSKAAIVSAWEMWQ
jgi:hypothetical protein